MRNRLVAVAAAGMMMIGVAGGVSAAADGNAAPYQKSCVGIINSFQAAELGITPVETADEYFGGSVKEYQEMQRGCKTGNG